MNTKTRSRWWLFLLVSLVLLSCKTLDSLSLRFPAGSLPEMEKDADAMVKALNTGNVYVLDEFVQERYSDEELAKPSTLKFTATLKNDKPTYFSYGWCTTTEDILKENYQHIRVELFFDGKKLGNDVVHTLTYNTTDGMICGEYGVLFLKIPAGTYRIEAVATFDQAVNDGVSDYEAGEYFYEYNVTVEE